MECDGWRPRRFALATAAISLTGCATVASRPRVATVCPPVIEYSREFQAQAVEELALLPEGSTIAEMLSDYAVLREQVLACECKTAYDQTTKFRSRGMTNHSTTAKTTTTEAISPIASRGPTAALRSAMVAVPSGIRPRVMNSDDSIRPR